MYPTPPTPPSDAATPPYPWWYIRVMLICILIAIGVNVFVRTVVC